MAVSQTILSLVIISLGLAALACSPKAHASSAADSHARSAEPPRVRVEPERQVVRPGDSPRFHCRVQSDHPYSFHWEADGRSHPSSANTSDDQVTLQFHNIPVADQGRYICLASNRYGMTQAAVEVVVEGSSAGARATGASGRSSTPAAPTPPTAAGLRPLPAGGAATPSSAPAAAGGGSAPGQTRSSGSSRQTPAAPTPAPPACNAPLPDGDTVSRYRNLSAAERDRWLLEAAKEGAAGEVRGLLVAGADVEARGWSRYTALHWAAHGGHADVAGCLLAGGAEVDARSRAQNTPLHWAAWNGHTAVVRLLAATSADLNARNQWGRTPLHYAAENGHTEAAAALLQAGADRGLRDNEGKTPLDRAKNQELRQVLTES